MNPEQRKWVAADQQPDPDSTTPKTGVPQPPLAYLQRAAQLSTGSTATDAVASVYATELSGHVTGWRHLGRGGQPWATSVDGGSPLRSLT